MFNAQFRNIPLFCESTVKEINGKSNLSFYLPNNNTVEP